jgi:hypothetical protein
MKTKIGISSARHCIHWTKDTGILLGILKLIRPTSLVIILWSTNMAAWRIHHFLDEFILHCNKTNVQFETIVLPGFTVSPCMAKKYEPLNYPSNLLFTKRFTHELICGFNHIAKKTYSTSNKIRVTSASNPIKQKHFIQLIIYISYIQTKSHDIIDNIPAISR